MNSSHSQYSVVEASVYLKHFSSDRSHMYNSETQTWSAPPPEYACIEANGQTTNLNEYIAMIEPKCTAKRGRAELVKHVKDRYGVTMTLTELQELFDCD